MHIPDGFVSGPINGAAAVVSAAAVGFSVWRVKREVRDRKFAVPLLATTAAFVFAAQMLNFPIGGGTSGHFLGAATAAALLGPWSACIVLALVLVIQGLLFADGGISALGSNILNMGIIGGMVGYLTMRGVRALLPTGRGGYLASAAVASWASVVLASSVCALELAMSGTSPLGIALPAMAGTHAIIGIGEALIAAAVLAAVATARPDIIPEWANLHQAGTQPKRAPRSVWVMAAAGLALAVALAVFGSPFASEAPDGLEKVAEQKGFMQAASEDKVVWTKALFPDYKVTAIGSEKVSTSLGGVIGTMAAFGLGFVAIKLIMRPPAKGGGEKVT
jgi:cobalt/nickel transport system permease protein